MNVENRSLPDGSAVGLATPVAGERESVSTSGYALFVIPTKRGEGFRASIRGYLLELADPDSGHGLAPTPEDLLTAAVAADVAWFARRFLHERGLDGYVSVTARTSERLPGPGALDVTVDVSDPAGSLRATLADALKRRVAARSSLPPELRVRLA
jgi:hypothetical protein